MLKKMKKAAYVLLAALMMALWTPTALFAAENTWVFGEPGGRLTADSQGVNGFYYMFTRQFNTGGVYDIAQFDYLIWSSNTTWRFFGGNAWTPPYTGAQIDDRFFNPNAVNEHGQPAAIDDYWFAIFGDGRVLPGANFTPVIRWDAPGSGTFTVDVVLHAGVNRQFFDYYTAADAAENERVDGMTTTIMHGRDRLFTANSGIGQVDENRVAVPRLTVNMAAGESLYFITDQNADPAWDYSTWHITITEVAAVPLVEEEVTEAAPVADEPTAREPTEEEPTPVAEVPTEDDAVEEVDEPTEAEPTEPTVVDEPTDGTLDEATEYMVAEAPSEADRPTVPTEVIEAPVLVDDAPVDDAPTPGESEGENGGSLPAAVIVLIVVGILAIGGVAAAVAIKKVKK